MSRRRNMTDDEFKTWFFANVTIVNACWQWNNACDSDGYGIVKLHGIQYKAHRVAFALHNGSINDALLVLHRCDNPPCINPAHLFQGTHSDNVQDCISKGRGFVGRLNPGAKFSLELIDALKATYATGEYTYEGAGAVHGVSKAQAFVLITGRRYKR